MIVPLECQPDILKLKNYENVPNKKKHFSYQIKTQANDD